MALKEQKDVLIAWINGENLQYQIGNTWKDCIPFEDITRIYLDEYTYRIKPKEIVSTTWIERDGTGFGHQTFGSPSNKHNLRLTWAADGETLLKAEVIHD